MRKPKASTTAVNITSAAIAFEQEIGSAVADFFSGAWFSDTQGSIQRLKYAATGVDSFGTVHPDKLTGSVVSKLAGYGFNKAAKWFLKRMRF
jgi:hypothetical protein